MIVRNESYVKQMKKTLNIYHLLKEEFKLYDIYQDFNDLYMLKDGTVVRRLKFYFLWILNFYFFYFLCQWILNFYRNAQLKFASISLLASVIRFQRISMK